MKRKKSSSNRYEKHTYIYTNRNIHTQKIQTKLVQRYRQDFVSIHLHTHMCTFRIRYIYTHKLPKTVLKHLHTHLHKQKCQQVPQTCIKSHKHLHEQKHPHTVTHRHTHTHTHRHTHTYTQAHTLTHTETYPLSHSLKQITFFFYPAYMPMVRQIQIF